MNYKKKPKTLGELRRRIDAYFNSRLTPILDKSGVPVTDEKGEMIKKITLPYTLTGLALALGCESREELLSFENPEMSRYVKMSVLKVEEYAEERLFSKEASSGVKLFLAVNFDRWSDNSVSESSDDDYILPESIGKWSV